MPQMVALFNGFGGAASFLVAGVYFSWPWSPGQSDFTLREPNRHRGLRPRGAITLTGPLSPTLSSKACPSFRISPFQLPWGPDRQASASPGLHRSGCSPDRRYWRRARGPTNFDPFLLLVRGRGRQPLGYPSGDRHRRGGYAGGDFSPELLLRDRRSGHGFCPVQRSTDHFRLTGRGLRDHPHSHYV
jgi:hypothetical protein